MKENKMTLIAFILMILTSVFGVTNIGIGFYNMGYAAIPFYIFGGLFYFLPYIYMMLEFSSGFKDEKGGIYTWMSKSVNVKFAFAGIMMWYSSYIIWMFNKSLSIWVPLSYAIYGVDKTTEVGTTVLGLVAIIFVVLMTFLITLGSEKFTIISSIGGMAVIALNILLLFGGLIVLAMNGFQFSEPINGMSSFLSSPNPDYSSTAGFLGFLVFAVFAYGGTEAIIGVGENLENPKKNLRKGIVISGLFVIICYTLGFLMVGAVMPYTDFAVAAARDGGISSMSALYLIMGNLGSALGQSFGGTGEVLSMVLTRFSGFAMFVTFAGAFIALSYAPLKQLIEGTPKELWNEKMQKTNENGMLIYALKLQAIIVVAFIALKVLLTAVLVQLFGEVAGTQSVAKLFDSLISMSNISMTLPYLFLIYAYYKFRMNDNMPKGVIIFKSKTTVAILSIITFAVVAFANIFSIVQPLIDQGAAGLNTVFWLLIGPIFFGGAGVCRYNRRKKLIKE